MNHDLYKLVPIAEITPSPTNPRKHFPEEYLRELSASIAARGIIQPLLVRSRDDLPPPVGFRYELIAGECRLRASTAAGLTEVPVLVRDDLSPNDVVELQLIENLQRRDLDVLEEADSYAELLALMDADRPRYTLETLSTAIGKDKEYVRQRLLLRRLPETGRVALREGTISFSVARRVAQIPSEKLREQAMDGVLHPKFENEPLTARKASEYIREEFMVELKSIPFSKEDADLVPVETGPIGERLRGGACTDCPFLSANSEDAEEGASPNLCTLPECYKAKLEASWQIARSAALKEGKRVLSEEESEKHVNDWADELKWDSPYVLLSEKVPGNEISGDFKKPPTWKKLLSEVEVKPEIIVVRAASGKPLEVVDRRQAVAAIKHDALKNCRPCPLKCGRAASEEVSAEREKERETQKIHVLAQQLAMTALVDVVCPSVGEDPSVFFPRLLDLALDHAGGEGLTLVSKWMGVEIAKSEEEQDLASRIREELMDYPVGEAYRLAPYVLILLMATGLRWASKGTSIDPFTENFRKVAESFGLDLKAIAKEAKETVKAEKKEAKQSKKAKAPQEEEEALV